MITIWIGHYQLRLCSDLSNNTVSSEALTRVRQHCNDYDDYDDDDDKQTSGNCRQKSIKVDNHRKQHQIQKFNV